MESNSDKAMRNKLQGVEMPFDPAAWEQMEAMLNKDDKKRGFFWWWFGAGVAALLLLSGAGAYLAMHNGNAHSGQLAVNTEKAEVKGEATVGSRQGNIVGNDGAGGSTQLNEVGNEKGEVSNVNADLNTSIGNEQLSAVGSRQINKARNEENSAKPSSTRNPQLTTDNSSAIRKSKSTKRASSNNQQLTTGNSKATRNTQPATSNSRNTSTSGNGQQTTGNYLLADFNGKYVASSTTAATVKDEAASLDKYWLTYLKPSEETYSPVGVGGDDELPKKMRAKVFQYSIGALGHVSAALVKNDIENKGMTLGYRPTSMGGFTHDFLFANRFAISNSILYAQSNFTVKNVRSDAFNPAPISFNTRITELAIPIGVKVYAVAKPKVRFYVSAGIINHIKLSETFTYNVLPKVDTVVAPLPTVTNNYPYETSFDGTGTGSVETTDGYTLGPAGTNATTVVTVNSNEFSINNAKRYYASFYAGAGIEGVIKNKWILFAEPSFSMDLQKIGIQERRKYNVGANLGFRYQF